MDVCTNVGPAQHQDVAQALRRSVGLIGQRGHQRRDVGRVGELALRAALREAATEAFRRASGGAGCAKPAGANPSAAASAAAIPSAFGVIVVTLLIVDLPPV